MSGIASKNLYEALGNDPELDPNREPDPPVKTVDKPQARYAKRDTPDVAPSKPQEDRAGSGGRGGRGGRRGGFGGNEGAFRDRESGSLSNRGKPVDDNAREDRQPRRGGFDRGRSGYRGGGDRRFKQNESDRHSRGVPNEHVKQTDQAWGAPTGDSELQDEQAGEAIAAQEVKEGFDTTVDAPVDAEGNKLDADAEAAEEEDNTKSYGDYLAELAEKKLKLNAAPARQANEGTKDNKKWANAKPISKEEDEDAYFVGGSGKAARQRERKTKETVEIDHRFVEAPRTERGGRGGGRGDRGGRGEFRGDRGDRGDRAERGGRGDRAERGDRGGRGEFRGDRGGRGGRGRGDFRGRGEGGRGDSGRGGPRGDSGRGGPRGGGGRGDAVNVSDTSAFPSLGA